MIAVVVMRSRSKRCLRPRNVDESGRWGLPVKDKSKKSHKGALEIVSRCVEWEKTLGQMLSKDGKRRSRYMR